MSCSDMSIGSVYDANECSVVSMGVNLITKLLENNLIKYRKKINTSPSSVI
jgi:hypothetical protein